MNRRGFIGGLLTWLGIGGVSIAETKPISERIRPAKEVFVPRRRIRLWKLGSLEHRVVPTQETMERLTTILAENHEDLELVWGPDISVQEINVSSEDLDIILRDQDLDKFVRKVNAERFKESCS